MSSAAAVIGALKVNAFKRKTDVPPTPHNQPILTPSNPPPVHPHLLIIILFTTLKYWHNS